MTLLDQRVITPISTQDDFTGVIVQSSSEALVRCFTNRECVSFPYKQTVYDPTVVAKNIEWASLARMADAFWIKKPENAKEDTFEILMGVGEQQHFLRFPYETLIPTLRFWYTYIPKHLSSKTYFTMIPTEGEERVQVLALRDIPQEIVPMSTF